MYVLNIFSANADNAFDANKPFDSSDDATAVDDTLNGTVKTYYLRYQIFTA